MVFKIQVTKLALEDISKSVRDYTVEGSRELAEKLVAGLDETIQSLEELPRRCPFAPEHEDLDFQLRQILFDSHRVIFTVEQDGPSGTVYILRVFDTARRPLLSE